MLPSSRFLTLTLPALALMTALAACKPATPVAADAATPAQAAPAPAAAAGQTSSTQASTSSCPDADFDTFLTRFSASAEVQRTATADPLTMVSIDPDAQPEPAPVSRQVPMAEVKFPVMPDEAARAAEGLEQSITELAPDRREVRVNVPDSGVQQRFEFQAAPCWKLVKVSDDTF